MGGCGLVDHVVELIVCLILCRDEFGKKKIDLVSLVDRLNLASGKVNGKVKEVGLIFTTLLI